MITLDVIIVDGSAVTLIATDEIETRPVRTRSELAKFISDRASSLSTDDSERLGRIAAVMASLDPSIVMSRDAESLGKLIDAHEFILGTSENGRSFGRGLGDTLQRLREMHRRPSVGDINGMLDQGPGSAPRGVKLDRVRVIHSK